MTHIPVLVDAAPTTTEGTLGGPLLSDAAEVQELETGRLKQSLNALTGEFRDLFSDMKEVGGFKLKEVTVAVEISAEGRSSWWARPVPKMPSPSPSQPRSPWRFIPYWKPF